MKNKNLTDQSDLVRSLASTIHKKMVAPSADRADMVSRELQQINQQLAEQEKEISRLDVLCRKTRFLACALAAGAALLSLLLFYIAR